MGRTRHRLPGRGRLPGHEHARRRRRAAVAGGHRGRRGGGGMQAALAITAALAGRAATGRGAYLDVSVAEGVLWLTSLAIDEQLALGGDVLPGHDILSGRYACYGTYAGSDGKWLAVGAIEAKFFVEPVRGAGVPGAGGVAVRRHGPGADPVGIRGGLCRADTRTSGCPSWPGGTPAWRPCSRSPR